ncbi:histamine H4 receptor isoform X2 [Talpa occidentalis]|uniref:histamine H4 receptor isoform X2 n=1 Tax=Talpa occidentalis TaxID=50954 RepID=UPI00188FCCB0|nr:histamine H4 receptor isoform X2 [Talpa occidentalis]
MSDNSTTTYSPSTRITLAFLMSLLAFAIMVGNAIVIIAFVMDKNLRHRSNYFFLNLAISDFFVVSDSWKNEKTNCEPGFLSEWYILAITSFLEFLVPVFSVAYFNMYIYCSLWKRGNLSRWQRYPRLTSVSSINCGDSLSMSRVAVLEPREAAKSHRSERQDRKNSLLLSLRTQMNRGVAASKMSSLHHSDSVAFRQREHLELLKAKKLAGSLAILSGVFIICWAPYSLFTIIRSIYRRDQHPKSIGYEITFWLQWFNSFVNPFLYPLCHKHFQKAFLKIFCIKKPLVPSHSQLMCS